MSTLPNSPDPQQSPEEYAAFLRAQTEEAVTASVHHASLSQQYLTLSQTLSAMSEQAASGESILVGRSTGHLERKTPSQISSKPSGVAQSEPVISAISASQRSDPAGNTEKDSNSRIRESSAGFAQIRNLATPDTEDSADLSSEKSPSVQFPVELSAAVIDESTTGFVSQGVAVGSQDIRVSGKSRRQRSPSSLGILDRARTAAREKAERMGLRARKADRRTLDPQSNAATGQDLRQSRTPVCVSAALNGLVLLLLGLKQLDFLETAGEPPILAGFSEMSSAAENLFPEEPPMMEVGEQQEIQIEIPVDVVIEQPQLQAALETEQFPESTPELRVTESMLPPASTLRPTPDGNGASSPDGGGAGNDPNGTGNRSEAGRSNLVKKYGGSVASESAVGNALIWLNARQRQNGSWDFIDVGPCSNPGTANNPIGGTAYALLPFLAAGQTHRDGPYKKQVQAGLDFLMTVGVNAQAGYDLRGVVNKSDRDEEPNYAYYVHGAATLALCEAYAMTKDRKLKPAAESAVLFLINSQDPRGGGWRYNPQQPGSTSATAIQLMALKAAEKAGFRIPDATFKGVSFYLDSVAVDREGRYGYEIEKKQYAASVTSMALLSRMYLGWGRDDGDLRAGVALIDKKGPYDNLYYNYFATQVMKNWGGKEWDRWNGRMRDDLIAWQEQNGDAKGSWAPRDRDDYSRAGGRLLTTCLATLTLEVYYRYHPLLPELIADAGVSGNFSGGTTVTKPADTP